MNQDKQLMEKWWINLYDSIEPAISRVMKKYHQSPESKEYKKKYYQKNKERILARLKKKK